MNRTDFVVRFAGEGGQGLLTSATAFAGAHTKGGYYTQTFATFPSQIIGGPTWVQARVSTSEVFSRGDQLDVLVAFNMEAYETHKDEVREDGVIIYDSGVFQLDDTVKSLGIPFDRLAKSTGNNRAANFVGMGALARLVNIPLKIFEEFNANKYSRGRPGDEQIVESNNMALLLGSAEADKSGFALGQLEPPKTPEYDQILVNGNEAICLGACHAGLQVFIGYPISPASSILMWMQSNLVGSDRFAYQGSSEIESITAIIGSSFAGKKSMSATAGPGFSLMSEGLGLAWMAEIPLVVANVQRGGPSTGLPTKTEQSDLFAVLTPAHGDVRLPVIAPGTVEECFYATVTAFNWAERYQGPVVLLSEHSLSERQQNIRKPDLDKVMVENRQVYLGENGYRRYEDRQLSPMPIPGNPGSYVANGSEHDPMGDTTHLADRHVHMTKRRFGKLELLNDGTYESRNTKAAIALMPWGGSKGPTFSAYEQLIESGEDIAWYYTMFLNPLPHQLLDELKQKELVIVPELNYQGQFSTVLRSFGVHAESITEYTGLPFKVSDLTKRVSGKMKDVIMRRDTV